MPKDDIQRGQNFPVVILVTILYTALLLSFLTSDQKPFDNLKIFFNTISAKDGIFAFLAPLISLILSGAFAKNLKEMLVFWKQQYNLPGHRAFSVIMDSIEPKVSETNLRANMLKSGIIKKDELPSDPSEQNDAWYKMYLEYKKADDSDVISLSKNYIKLRDSATVGFFFTLFGSLALILTGTNVRWIPIYLVVTLLLYLLLASSARNYAKNLVHSVMYKYSTRTNSKNFQDNKSTKEMKIIVVLNTNSDPWKRLKDVSFASCPQSPVKYRDTVKETPVPILHTCPGVKIINEVTGDEGTGTPIEIN